MRQARSVSAASYRRLADASCSSAARSSMPRRAARSRSLNPLDGSTIAEVAEAARGGRRSRGRRRPSGVPGMEAHGGGRARPAAAETGRPDRSGRRGAGAAGDRSTPAIRSATRACWTCRARRRCFRYFGGMADKLEGTVVPVDAGFLNYVAARADGRGRPDRAMEFPADVHQLEDGTGAGGGQHRGAEARGNHAAVDPAHRAN